MMLPPRYWPTSLWVVAGAVALLLAYAITLAVLLIGVQLSGGFPPSIHDPIGGQYPAIVEAYAGAVFVGVAPMLIFFVLGLIIGINLVRQKDDPAVPWARIFIAALGILAIACVLLILPTPF